MTQLNPSGKQNVHSFEYSASVQSNLRKAYQNIMKWMDSLDNSTAEMKTISFCCDQKPDEVQVPPKTPKFQPRSNPLSLEEETCPANPVIHASKSSSLMRNLCSAARPIVFPTPSLPWYNVRHISEENPT